MKKTALVTGGVRRLGRDIAIELDKLGYDVIVTYNKSKIPDVKKVNYAVALKIDVTNTSEIKNLFSFINKRYKRLDVVINNAGIFRNIDFFKISEKDFDEFINTNLKSQFFISQYASKLMLKNKTSDINVPQIINIASLGALQNWTGYIPYSISKSGVIKLTQQLAKRLAPDILVNSISPGTIIIENDENDTVNFNEMKKYPMKKFGDAKDITSLIKFLVTENKFITGHNFIVDGGKLLN
ncbi:MAG TPA: SDR family oxidoreductase [Ignavibacteria bacterium]|nr:SDR family oxidoreductase [Ignavibacteria bacterium]